MRKFFTLLTLVLLFSCASDNETEVTAEIPEKFDIRIEIEGKSSSKEVYLLINSTIQKKWKNNDLPVVLEYTYNTAPNDLNILCNCVEINIGAYLDQTNEMEKFKLYINGDLVDSTTVTNSSPGGLTTPTSLGFTYYL